MVERIKAIMTHYQLRAAQFSDAIGMQRSAVSHVLSGRNKPSLDFILRIKRNFPEISLNWLTMGEGNMFENEGPLAASVPHDLFARQPAPEKESVGKVFPENIKPVEATAKSEVNDEEAAFYGAQKSDGHLTRVLFVYDDGTFSEFKPRK